MGDALARWADVKRATTAPSATTPTPAYVRPHFAYAARLIARYPNADMSRLDYIQGVAHCPFPAHLK